MLQITLIDENSQNLLKMLQTERHQTSKLTKFNLPRKSEKCVSEPKQLSVALKYGTTTHLQLKLLNIIKVKEGGESVLIYT